MDLARAYGDAGPKIVGYLVATGTDEATARDLLHDAVARVERWLLLRGAGHARAPAPGRNLAAILFATARNLRKNLVRDQRRMSVVESPEELDRRTVDGRRTTAASDADYLRRRIAAALVSLPVAHREAYTLYQIGERSVREVAALTGASESLVKVRLFRAKKALQAALADLDADGGATAAARLRKPNTTKARQPCSRQTRSR